MSKSPTLTAILPVPGIETTTGARSDERLSVGVVVSGERIAWGTCLSAGPPPLADRPALWPPFRAEAAVETLNSILAPRLLGQPLGAFRQLVAGLDEVTEAVTVPKRLPDSLKETEGPEEKESLFSRRALITGRLEQEGELKPPVEYETVERPIHPALRYGISQALLAAVAMERGTMMADVIAAEYDLPRPGASVPVQAVIKAGQSLQLLHRVDSLAYESGRVDPPGELGSIAEKLQRFVRQLKERIVVVAAAGNLPALHLVLGGGLGRLYGNAAGKILGALYGLQQAADPCPLYVEDPLLLDSRQAQIEAMTQLAEYVRFRQMPVRLVAGSWINTLDDVAAFAAATPPVSALRLEMPHLGTIHKTIEAALICREAGIGFLLAGAPVEVAVQVAMAIQPDWLVAPADLAGDAGIAAVRNELARNAAWIRIRQG